MSSILQNFQWSYSREKLGDWLYKSSKGRILLERTSTKRCVDMENLISQICAPKNAFGSTNKHSSNGFLIANRK